MSDEDGIELRLVLPRSALPAAPAAVADFFSQLNCEALLGIKPRAFLGLLSRADAPPVTKIGKARLVERAPMLAFIAALGARARDESDDDGDRYLRSIGCAPAQRRVG